ncbi:hypothetical protein ACIBKY_43840 [Nonomuraea sp. NPDC050394]|uniref:hypothetical protein n=1 Tax=Nonomuraea sp. NPDC050394 TaxID=3364363 RepID=UPI0037A7F06A
MATLTFGLETSALAQIDPATALKRQLVDGRGAKISRFHMYEPGSKTSKMINRSTGIVEFGKGRVVATDVVHHDPKTGPTLRVVSFPDRWYTRDYPPDEMLPAGKSWFLHPAPSDLAVRCGPIELSHPASLKAVLATATVKRPAGTYDRVRTTLYQGRVTLGELYRANPDIRISLTTKPTGKYAKIPVTWRLWLGEDQLVRRCRTSYNEPIIVPGVVDDERFSTIDDIRLSRWGIKTDIQPPPEDQVASYDDFDPSDLPENK